MKMKKICRRSMLLFCISLLAISLACAFAACGGGRNPSTDDAEYYLSLASDNWQVFNSKESIPDRLHFRSEGENEYKLTIGLGEGEQFTVNKLNSDEKIGYDKVFTTADDLAGGENGSIKVAHGGTFVLFYNNSEDTLSYSYSAEAPEPVSGVQLDKVELSMELNATAKLEATVLPQNAENKLVSWASSNDSVVSVEQDGTITAVGYGTATITVTTAQNSCTAACTVTVVRHLSGIRFDRDSLSVTAGGSAKTLNLSFLPDDVTDTEYTLQVTEGSEFVSVTKGEDGVITVSGLEVGQAVLKAVSDEDPKFTATCTITVCENGSVLVDMPQNVQTMIEDSEKIELSIENGSIESVTWAVENEAVATIEGDGATAYVTGVEFGTTVVTATVTDDKGAEHVVTSNVLVADDYFFIYGYGFGKKDWDYEEYVGSRDAAEAAGLLFQETATRGIYTLTRHFTPENGFQIIFPKVANFTQHDNSTNKDVWSKNIPSDLVSSTVYYRSGDSDRAYVTNTASYFAVNASGFYTVTLDLTRGIASSDGTGYCSVTIKLDSLDVSETKLSLTQGNPTLKSGDSLQLGFSVNPSAAKFTEEQVEVKLDSDYADFKKYLEYEFNFAYKTISVKAKGEPAEKFSAVLTLTIRGVSASIELFVLPTAMEKNPVTEINFEQEKYEFNVNNGEGNWTAKVKATTNSDATNGQVRYYDVTDYDAFPGSSERAIVNEITGEVTARSLGTLKIMAVSLDDPSVTATVDLLFYSDAFYMVGIGYGGWDALSQSITTLVGTGKEKYAFTMSQDSNALYTLTYDTDVFGLSKQMKIVFLGIDLQWTGQITAANIAEEFSNAYVGWHVPELLGTNGDVVSEGQQNIQFLRRGVYTLTIDLSRPKPMLIIDKEGTTDIAKDYLLEYSGKTELHKGDVAKVELVTVPFKQYQSGDVTVSFEGNGGYLSYAFDSGNVLTFTVNRVEHAEDKTVTVNVTADGDTQTLSFQIIAEHHLELTWNQQNHWYRCTDEGCTYYEDSEGIANQKSEHNRQNVLSSNAEGHYYSCSKCGVEFNFEKHTYELNNGVFDFSEGMEECSACHFQLFLIEGTTLKAYYGYAESVNVPDTVTILGDHVFEGHSEIKNLTYSNRLTKIGAYAFAGCTSLQTVKIPNFVTDIGGFAFKGCSANIKWGNIPRIQTIVENAFNGYLGTEIEIPSTVTTIWGYAFANSNLISITIPDGTYFGDKSTAHLNDSVFRNCKMLTSVVLGKKINILPAYLFDGCESLEYVLIRGSEFWAFSGFGGCSSLKAVYVERDASNFSGSNPIVSVSFPDELLEKVYFYTETQPDGSMTFEKYTDYFAGLWHYSDVNHPSLKNVVVWPTEAATTAQTAVAFYDDKRRAIACVI